MPFYEFGNAVAPVCVYVCVCVCTYAALRSLRCVAAICQRRALKDRALASPRRADFALISDFVAISSFFEFHAPLLYKLSLKVCQSRLGLEHDILTGQREREKERYIKPVCKS